jgi:thiamine pyrophosphokinase
MLLNMEQYLIFFMREYQKLRDTILSSAEQDEGDIKQQLPLIRKRGSCSLYITVSYNL